MDQICGSYELKCLDSEQKARQNARRSIVSLGKIAKGEIITEDKLTFKRPGTGISPAAIQSVVGRTALTDIEDDTILTTDLFG